MTETKMKQKYLESGNSLPFLKLVEISCAANPWDLRMLFFAVYTMYTFISSMRINLSEIIPLSSTAKFDLNFTTTSNFHS